MSTAQYLTAPVPSSELPKGIPYIVGNEAAERFSFYGMKTILVVFMSQYLMSSQAAPAYMTETQSREWMHWFVASAYFTPIFGAILADAILGKYRTILLLSLVYCAGHLATHRIVLGGSGLGRHQAMRVCACGRSVWRKQQALTHPGVRMVLLCH
jgi:dipeptide/tripeptide permease